METIVASQIFFYILPMIYLLFATLLSQEITLENDFFKYTWQIDENSKLTTKNILNKRTVPQLTLIPAEGSEEFVIALPGENADDYPAPLEKSKWTIDANSEQNSQGQEGPAKNLLDNDLTTIWHSYYAGSAGHDDRNSSSDPFRFTIDTNELLTIKSISYTQRSGGGNGVVKDFEFYAAETREDLEKQIAEHNPTLEGQFVENHGNKCYVNLTNTVKGQFFSIVTYGDGTFASGAEFDMYDKPLPTIDYFIKTSDLSKAKAEVNETTVVFTFEQYTFKKVKWDIREIVEMDPSKHYLHKYLEIKSSKEESVIDYIDLAHFVISEDDMTHSWGTPMIENVFKNLGQPIYINTMFIGCQFPLTYSVIDQHARLGHVSYYTGKNFTQLSLTSDGYYRTWKTVFGFARSNRMEVVRNDFFSYIADIQVPSPFRKQYNSWYDWMLEITEDKILTSFKEIERGCSQYGLPPFDSYVVDDGWNNYNYNSTEYHVYQPTISGTTYNEDGFWTFNNKFPNKFYTSSNYTRKISSYFGVWLGPRGGYATPGQFGHMIENAGKGYYAPLSNDVDVAAPKYIENVKNLLISFIRDFKVNYYKLDGFTATPCNETHHGHMVGGFKDLFFFTDLWEHYIAAYQEMINAAKEVGLDNFWISSTTFTNLSPFHLQWSNSVWIQVSSDMGETIVGGNDNEADQMLTYRDQCYWTFYDERQFQFPAKNLYNHDPIYGQASTSLRNSMDDDYFRTFLSGCAMRGTAFYELYYTYDMVDEGDKWYVNADVLSWAENNFHILQHSQRFGGRPDQGQVYGYSAWDSQEGIFSLRNPGGEVQEFSIILDRDIGVPESHETFYRSTRLDHRTTATEEIKNGVPYKYGDTLKVTLQPGELRIYEFRQAIDTLPPAVEVIKTVSSGEVNIRFDKYVDISHATFAVDGLTVSKATLRGDKRTVTITVVGMENYTNYNLAISNVQSIFGNAFTKTIPFQYFALNAITNKRGSFKGDGSNLLETTVSTDSFTINLNIIDFGSFTDGALVHSEDNQIIVELLSDHTVKFTVGEISVVSESTLDLSKPHLLTFVRERNALIKIYIDHEIDASSWNKKMPLSETLHNIFLNSNPVTYQLVQIFNYGLAYNETSTTISIKNDFIEREFTISNNKIRTSQIINYRTDTTTVMIPEKASAEWKFVVPAQPASVTKVKAPTPIDRKDWKITANSEQATSGSEGPVTNMIDGKVTTIWHSLYSDAGKGGHDDRANPSDPFQVTIDFGKQISFKAFSHSPRHNSENGAIHDYEIYTGNTKEELQENINSKKPIHSGRLDYLSRLPAYVNFTKEHTAQFLALVFTQSLGSGADFSLYADFVPIPVIEISSTQFNVADYSLQDGEVQTLTINYEKTQFYGTDYTVTEIHTLPKDKHYIEKQLIIEASDKNQVFNYIELESFALSSTDMAHSWTHPVREQDIDSGLTPFVINLGQPVYINTIFLGCRFPLNDNAIEEQVAHLRYHTGKSFDQLEKKDNKYYCWKTVVGAARSNRLEVVRKDLFAYISDISVPTTFRKQYNSWYDWMLNINESNILTSFKEIERGCSQYGVPPLDSYVVDDGWNNYNSEKYNVYNPSVSGTTNNTAGFWVFNTKFPDGLTRPSDFAHRISSKFGVWLGPRGGYVTPGQLGKIIEDGGNGYYNAASGDVDVGSVKYISKLDEFLSNWIREYKINYFKLDGFASLPCENSTHDHMVGGLNGAYYFTDLWERYEKVFEHFREVAQENEIADFWISITCFVNPSPFHLQWANSVWFQVSGDVGYIDIGGNSNLADQMLTYRDSCYYNFSDYLQFQFPQKCLYNHDPIYGKAGTVLEGALDDDYFRTFLYFCAMRGNAFTEMYYTYTMLDEGDKWYINSEVLKWTEERFDVLQNSQRFGGDPRLGDVYGYSAWNEESGVVAIRNPSGEVKEFTLKLDRDAGVPENIKTTYRKSVLTHKTEEDVEEGKETKYGDEYVVQLQPGEARIIDFESAKDTTAPSVEVIKTYNHSYVSIRFNKRIVQNDKNYRIDGVKISRVEYKGDLRTVILKCSAALSNNTDYTLYLDEVSDQLGNKLTENRTIKHFVNGKIISLPESTTITEDTIIFHDTNVDTDSFSLELKINSRDKAESYVVLEEKSNANAFSVEIKDNKVNFILGSLTVTSKDELPERNTTLKVVRERNGMIKIYIDGSISASAYNKAAINPIVSFNEIVLHKSSTVYQSIFFTNYGLTYNHEVDPDDTDYDDYDDDNKESNKGLIIGLSVAGAVLVIITIAVSIIAYCKKNKEDNKQELVTTPLLQEQ